MTRKDFELIAAIIRAEALPDGARLFMATRFADKLATTNPAFDRARFLRACGI